MKSRREHAEGECDMEEEDEDGYNHTVLHNCLKCSTITIS